MFLNGVMKGYFGLHWFESKTCTLHLKRERRLKTVRFSEKKKGINITTNYEGEVAYKLTPKMELYTLVCTASLQKEFYTDKDECINRLKTLLPKVPIPFAAKLAVYAREEMHLRSIPLVIAVELLKLERSKLTEDFVERVIQRADEIPEMLSYFQLANEREGTKKLNRLPNALKKGIARAFHKFDEYQFAKYNRDTEVRIRDAMFLTHPKPDTKEKEELFKKIADDTLAVPYTWEVELSKEDGRSKKEKWEQLIASKKLGYMAQLRNLRNMLDERVDNIEEVLDFLSDPINVLHSRQLPFRFLSAYKEIVGFGSFRGSTALEALEQAMQHSTVNIKGFNEKTNVLIACDMSGSMSVMLSPKSKVHYYDIGLTLGMLLQSKCKSVITGIFGEAWKVVQLPRTNILANIYDLAMLEDTVGHSTNGYLAIRYLRENKLTADKVLVFTDCQLWDSRSWYEEASTIKEEWQEYKKLAPDAKLYLFDMAGYGNTPINLSQKDVYMIAGWSEKVFEVLNAIEKGQAALSVIERIKI